MTPEPVPSPAGGIESAATVAPECGNDYPEWRNATMSVEIASEVLAGDRIRLDDNERMPGMEVTSTEHGPTESVLCLLDDAGHYRRLVFLPDDPVMVTYYGSDS